MAFLFRDSSTVRYQDSLLSNDDLLSRMVGGGPTWHNSLKARAVVDLRRDLRASVAIDRVVSYHRNVRLVIVSQLTTRHDVRWFSVLNGFRPSATRPFSFRQYGTYRRYFRIYSFRLRCAGQVFR